MGGAVGAHRGARIPRSIAWLETDQPQSPPAQPDPGSGEGQILSWPPLKYKAAAPTLREGA